MGEPGMALVRKVRDVTCEGSGDRRRIFDFMRFRRYLGAFLTSVMLVPLTPIGRRDHLAAAAGSPLQRCGAITVDERPPLGGGGFNTDPYVRAHNRYLRRHPDVFASGYLSGKRFYVGFTRHVCHHLRRIRQMVDKGWRFRAFVAIHTYRELRRAQRCVTHLMGRRRLRISAVGVDVWRNKLEVMLRRRTERRERIIRRECGTVRIRFTEGVIAPE